MATRRRRTTPHRRTVSRRRVTRRSSRRRRKSIQIRLSEHVSREIWAIFFLGFTVINFLSLQGNAGGFGEIWNHSVITPVFGALAYVVPAFSLLISLTLFFSKKISFELGRVLGIAMLCISVLGIVQLSAPIESMFEMAPQYGGYVGFTSNFILYLLFGSTGAAIVLVGTALVSLLMVFNISFSELFGFFKDAVTGDEKEEKSGKFSTKVKSASADTEIEEFELNIVRADQENEKNNNKAKRIVPISESENIKPATESAPASAEDESSLNSRSEDYSNYRFPELSFLSNDAKNKDYGDDLLVQNAEIIRRKLEQFSIRVTMKDAHVGPTVIQYTLKPAEDVKISKITSLKNDLALALSAQAIRIEAPIPGKGLVGIEIPAHHRAIVQIGGIIKSATFQNHTGYLSLVLGRDVSGLPMVADLTEMPHLLVAGQTGSGKSIGINSFLISLLYQHSPETLRMILIDPKRVELTNYNGLPHLLTPVITEPDKALQSLKWAVSEMNRRYKELARHGKRNIEEYNKTFPHNRMPFIVLVIDELADLMMAASKEIEATICRLAQMARATGIHLIIATQRPSVDVITGLIKANIPTRVAFTVATGVDSRTIIDGIGAEDLLGKGDMLYMASDMAKPLRLQGSYISTKEAEKVIHFIKLESPTGVKYDDSITEEQRDVIIPGLAPSKNSQGISGDSNSDLEMAIQAIREGQKASASFLQRRCSFGYAKAARILDELEEMGLVGPSNGAKPRAIFISKEVATDAEEAV